jgi:hypothetical protein
MNYYRITSLPFLFLMLILSGCAKPQSIVVTIPIEGAKFIEITPENILGQVSVIPLETTPTCLIAEGYMFLDCTQDFYVQNSSPKQIVRFAADGHFLNTIGKLGKGPGEYTDFKEGIVTESGVELLTGFPHGSVVSSFTKDGSFKSQKEFLERFSNAFAFHQQSNDYLFYGYGYANKILRLDNGSGERVDSMLLNITGAKVFPWHPFTFTPSGTILFCEGIINKIYEINSSGIIEKYRLDFGSLTICEDITAEEFQKKITNAGLWSVEKVLENEDYLYLCATKNLPDIDSPKNHLIYRKEDKSLFRFSGIDSFSTTLDPAFHINSKDELFFSLSPVSALNSNNWNDYFERKGLKVKADDNPLVVIMNIKKVIQLN